MREQPPSYRQQCQLLGDGCTGEEEEVQVMLFASQQPLLRCAQDFCYKRTRVRSKLLYVCEGQIWTALIASVDLRDCEHLLVDHILAACTERKEVYEERSLDLFKPKVFGAGRSARRTTSQYPEALSVECMLAAPIC